MKKIEEFEKGQIVIVEQNYLLSALFVENSYHWMLLVKLSVIS